MCVCVCVLVLVIFVRSTFELKLWVRLSQGVLACVGDIVAAGEVENLEVRTSSCYFQHAGIEDVPALPEVECLEIRTSFCYFQHAGVGNVAAASEDE